MDEMWESEKAVLSGQIEELNAKISMESDSSSQLKELIKERE